MADYDWKNGDPLTNWVVMSAVDDKEQRSSDIEIDGSVSSPDDLTEIDTGVNCRLADLMGEGGMKSPTKGTIDDVYDKVDSIGDWQSQRIRYKLLQRQVLNINGGLTTANVGTYHSLNGGSDNEKGAAGMVSCLPLETMVKSMKAFGFFKYEGQSVSFDELLTLAETPAFLHDAQKWQDLEGDVYAVVVGSEEQLQGDAQTDEQEEEEVEQTDKSDDILEQMKAEGKMTDDGLFVFHGQEKDPNAPERHFKGRIDEETSLVVFDEVDEDGNVIKTAGELVGAKPEDDKQTDKSDDILEQMKAEGKMTEDGLFVFHGKEKDPDEPERHFKGRIDEESQLVVFDEVDEDGNVIKTAGELVGAKPKEPEKPAFNGPTKANPDFDPNNTTDKYKMVFDEETGFFVGVKNPYYKPDPNKPKPKLKLIDTELSD